ncbi:MAG TPA: UpxY family transcription antiterminator [Terriglobales bacterium]|jgi:transcription antitermination factor NusG|nr:UpxY family transcription antiterminator [Terriglobales bacterium]
MFSTLSTPAATEVVDFKIPAQWFALYTNPRHEKVVARQLNERQVENFLPLYRTWHRWKDRRKQVEMALFPGYVFVRIEEQNKLHVLKVPGVVSLVSFNGKLAALPEPEIEALRNALDNQICAEPCPYLRVGKRVRVVRGPMTGAEGILSRKKDKYRVVISVEVLMRSVALEIDGADLEGI